MGSGDNLSQNDVNEISRCLGAMFDGSNDNGFDFSAPLETVLFLIRLTSSELRMD